jgi:prepilin-type N-terminal cleavage/methylation domain-containing protein
MRTKTQKQKTKLLLPSAYSLLPNRGYTLIEILVGLTIIGLLFTFGYASFREYSRRQALAGAARKVKADLRSAQGLALSGKKPESNCPILDGYRFNISGSSYSIKAVCGGSDKSIEKDFIPLPNGITSSSANILFKILGQGTNITGQITITLTQAGTNPPQTVTVDSGGKIE